MPSEPASATNLDHLSAAIRSGQRVNRQGLNVKGDQSYRGIRDERRTQFHTHRDRHLLLKLKTFTSQQFRRAHKQYRQSALPCS
jgi:hypothetical protein